MPWIGWQQWRAVGTCLHTHAAALRCNPFHAQQGVAVRLGTDGWLTVKVPDAEAAASMIAAINGRAAMRSALRQRAGGAPTAAAGPGGESLAPAAAGVAAQQGG